MSETVIVFSKNWTKFDQPMFTTLRKSKFAKEGEKVKLACAAAFTVADKFGVNPSEIGSICNDRNIRICHCQLGCFK